MKRNLCLRLALAALMAATPLLGRATIFFNDTFVNGSTLNSATPANPTNNNSTAYEMASSKSWSPTPTLTANDLKFGIAATTSGSVEVEALFATNVIALTANGDYIQLTVVFTNTLGLLTQSGSLGFGLYNSSQVKPIAGGMNGNATTTGTPNITGGAQNWQGYVGFVQFNAGSHRLLTRPVQSVTTGNNQDCVTTGSGSSSYAGAAGVGAAVASTLALSAGAVYTEVLTITLLTNDFNSLAISNTVYAGAGTGGLVVTNFGGIATNATLLTSGFDALAIGWRATANATATTIDIASIKVDGVATPVGTPPTITVQPVAVNVATGGSCIFNLTATGFNLTYQWHRNGTNLANGGNISGATSSALIINNASAADAASGANGYYCTVTGTGNFSVNSTTNALALVAVKNLVWEGTGTLWDLNNSPSWVGGQTFNYGDAVTFNDVGAASVNVTLSGNYLSASKWTISGNTAYAFGGSGVMAGTGSLLINSGANQQFNGTANYTFTGGTTISNTSPSVSDYFSLYQGLGNGPLTLAAPGKVEFAVSGSATVGIPGDITVNDDFTIQFDGTGTFGGVMLGNLSGIAGKTLTLAPQSTATLSRYRLYGTNTVCNANLVLNGATTDQAQYGGTVLASYNGSGNQVFNGVISGDGGLITRGGGNTILNAANTYAGGTTPTAGQIGIGNNAALGAGPLNLAPEIPNATGSGAIFASGGARTVANVIQYPSGTNNQTLIINGANDLTFTSPINLAGVDGLGTPTNRTFTVNNTGATTFAGAIGDASTGLGMVKNGTNTLYLNGVNTYSGLTTVSAGRLAGSGTIAGSVLVASTNATIGGGAASGLGTLSVSGGLVLSNNAGGLFRVNRTGSPTADEVAVTGGLTNLGTGTITITNLGGVLQVGDTFALFNKAVVGGNTLIVTGAGANWTNKLAFNGTVAVLSSVPTTPTNLTFSVAGSTLTVSWPASYLGWSLQSNAVSLSSTSGWFVVPGSAATTSMNFTANATKTNVFYRMVYP